MLPTWSAERNIQALRIKVWYPTLEIAILVHVVMSCCPRCHQIRRLSSLEMKKTKLKMKLNSSNSECGLAQPQLVCNIYHEWSLMHQILKLVWKMLTVNEQSMELTWKLTLVTIIRHINIADNKSIKRATRVSLISSTKSCHAQPKP